MQDTAPQKTLRDGAYTWRAVQPFGPSTAHRAEVEGGRVSVWQTGEGEGLFTTPAAYLEDASLFAAALLEVIEGRTRYGTSPVDFEPAPLPPIGNARAARLHRLKARVGLPTGQHYAFAAAALGEWKPVPSLAALSEREARTVWAH